VTLRLRDTERPLASGARARVLRIDADRFEVLPLFTGAASPAEDRLARVLGEARLGLGLRGVPPAAARLSAPRACEATGAGAVTCLAPRALPAPPGTARAGPLHLLRLAAGRLAPGELLVNGGYFLFLEAEVTGTWDAYGDPIGLALAASRVETPPQLRRACLLQTADGPAIRPMGFAEVSILLPDGRRARCHPFGPPASTAPAHPHRDAPIAFALFHGARDGATPEAPGAWEVAYVGRHAVATGTGGGMPIPRAGCVVRFASAPQAQAAGSIVYDLGPGLSDGVQAGPALVTDGAPVPPAPEIFDRELWRAAPSRPDARVAVSPHGWADDWHETRAARLGAGITAAGRLVLCAVEGTSSALAGTSQAAGATLHDLGCLMADEGAVTAMHLDGGGSTQVFCAGGGALIAPRDVHHGQPGSAAQFDRPLPLALRLA